MLCILNLFWIQVVHHLQGDYQGFTLNCVQQDVHVARLIMDLRISRSLWINTRGKTFRRILCNLSGNGWAEMKILSPSIMPYLSSLKFGIVGLDRLCIG